MIGIANGCFWEEERGIETAARTSNYSYLFARNRTFRNRPSRAERAASLAVVVIVPKSLAKRAWVRHRRGVSLPDPSTFIAEGASAAVYRLDGGRVLKLFHDGVDQSIIAREYRTAEAIQATGLPVAQLVGRQDVAGRQGIIYSEIKGPTLLAYIWRHPHRIGWAMRAMAALQRQIHGQSVPVLRSRKAILAEDIEMAPIGERLRAAAIDRLEQLVEGSQLSHGDLHPANLIVSDAGLAVIDWSKAARAAPASDVVRSEMLMRFGPGQSGGRGEGALRDTTTAYYVRHYRHLAGMEPEALTAWRALVGLAWIRHRLPGRDAAFSRYLAEALEAAGLPAQDG